MRHRHLLRRNKSVGFPHKWIFFDVETVGESVDVDVELQHLDLGWACYCRLGKDGEIVKQEWCCFEERGVFWDFVFYS